MKKTISIQEEQLRVLGKGMVTIPKAWRDNFGIKEGEFIKAVKYTNKIVIEPIKKSAPYRIYSKKELMQFLKDDRL